MTDETRPNEAEETPPGGVPDEPLKAFVHHQRIAFEEFGKAIEALLPPDFREHTRNASKSFTEAFKALFDAAKADIEQMIQRQRESKDRGEAPQEGSKVKVDIQ
jgi:hypothetical protein